MSVLFLHKVSTVSTVAAAAPAAADATAADATAAETATEVVCNCFNGFSPLWMPLLFLYAAAVLLSTNPSFPVLLFCHVCSPFRYTTNISLLARCSSAVVRCSMMVVSSMLMHQQQQPKHCHQHQQNYEHNQKQQQKQTTND